MMALSLTLGRWSLSFEVDRADDPLPEAVAVTLGGLAEATEPDAEAEASFGFSPTVLEALAAPEADL